MIQRSRNSIFFLLVFLLSAAIASAQSLGTRAEGMAGAFVGVADDASAVYWNPAGIASGPIVSAVVSFGSFQPGEIPINSAQPSATQRDSGGMVAISATAIGGAYYRLTTYGLGATQPQVSGPSGREEVGRSVHTLAVDTVGVSLLQSLGDFIVVAATPRFTRAVGDSAFDVDGGVMFSRNHVRLGLVARNLMAPAFARATAGQAATDAPDVVELQRQVRVGAAWGSGWTGISRVIVSVDSDLTSRVAPDGDRRDVAAGVETWWFSQRLGLRGGVRGSTIGDGRAAVAAGISAGLTSGMLVEAHVVRGHADDRAWSIGARMLF